MAPTLLNDTTSQFATSLGVEEIEVGLYCDVNERVVVEDVTTRLLLQPYPLYILLPCTYTKDVDT